MDVGEVRPIEHGSCTDLYVVETGMYDVTGYGGVYFLDSDRPAIVETGIGTDRDVILDALASVGIDHDDVEAIVLTHVHLDHAGGAGFLAKSCENATIFVSERGSPHLIDPERLVAGTKAAVGKQWRHYTEPVPVPRERIQTVGSDETIDLGNHHLIAYPAPGHARHQLVFHVPTMDAVFTGDATGLWIPDRQHAHQSTPPPEFDLEQAIADLHRIDQLAPTTLLFTHFGAAPGRTELLEEYANTLSAWVEAVDSRRSRTKTDENVIESFVEQTDLTEVWGEEKGRAETRLNVAGVLAYLDRQGSA